MIVKTLKTLIYSSHLSCDRSVVSSKTPTEKLEKAQSTLYDAASCKQKSPCFQTITLNFGKQTLKSLSLLFLMLFANSVIAQDYSDDDDEDNLPYVEIKSANNLQQLGQLAIQQQKIIFLEMSASYCGYCKTLEEHIIKPMLRSGDYENHVLIRKLDIDSHYPMKDFDGSKTSPAQYAFKVNASLTPTLLFLDGRGKEVSERILGVYTLEMYGHYVDDALIQGHRKIKH